MDDDTMVTATTATVGKCRGKGDKMIEPGDDASRQKTKKFGKAGPITWIAVALSIMVGAIIGGQGGPWWLLAVLVLGLIGSGVLWEYAQTKRR